MTSEKKSFHQLISESEVPVLVDVYSENCGPCHAMKPVLAELKQKLGEDVRIIKIDGRPAFEVYREVIAAEYQVAVNHENFYELAVHFPFGLVLATDVVVRIPVAFNDDGSIFCVGEVPPNSALRLLRAPVAGKSRCVEGLAENLGAVGGLPLTAFYCAGRRLHFGDQAEDELVRLQGLTGVAGIAGALTLGEIDCMAKFGFPRFHNAAIVCLAPGTAVAAPE